MTERTTGYASARVFLLLCAALLALRITGLMLSPLELHYDEAQYWYWSRDLDWGYFSKPPLIAWAIAGTTALFGNAEWAVRAAAPIAHVFGALALYVLARRMYGAPAGFWAGVLWLTMPSVWVSSAVISTDALVLPLWSLALYAFWRMSESRSVLFAVLLGVALGLGALAKYAMLYFPLCALLAAWWCAPARAAAFSWRALLALAIAAAILAPNLIWNVQNEFATVQHTAANANLEGSLLHPEELLEFLASQAGVVGPVLFFALLYFFWRAARRPNALTNSDTFLIAFVLPILAIILVQALVSRAHANWAAAAYPAAIVWLAGRLSAGAGGRKVLTGALATHILLGAFVFVVGVAPRVGDAAGLSDALKRMRGWTETATLISERASAANADSIAVDHRALFFELAYYGRDMDLPPVRMWRLDDAPLNHAEDVAPLMPSDGARTLVVHMIPRYVPLVAGDFESFSPGRPAHIPLGGGEERGLLFSIGQGFAPAARDSAFDARLDAARTASD